MAFFLPSRRFRITLKVGFYRLNILPVYPLDGGAIIFAFYEMVTGKKPSEKFVTICGMVGFIIIILFFWVFPKWVYGILGRVLSVFF